MLEIFSKGKTAHFGNSVNYLEGLNNYTQLIFKRMNTLGNHCHILIES